jgi:thioredoxin reductase
MARRFTLEGARVKAVIEIQKATRGLVRNVVQCLEDFGIPLYFRHKLTRIEGQNRVENVEVVEVDDNLAEKPETRFTLACDTVLVSVGLIPENELLEMAGVKLDPATNTPLATEAGLTSVPGIFACGNSYRIYDLVDAVTRDSLKAGKQAAAYLKGSAWRRN